MLLEALRAARPQEPRAAPEIVAAVPERPTVLHGKKVLLIDDTELLLVFVEEVLSTAEPTLQIVTASSGLAGVEKAIAEKPDLILLDYSLPDITGGEVCRRLLADERTARLPIIMMSGHVPEMLAVSDEYENVVAAIPKPFLSTALLELLDRTLTDLPKAKSSRRKRGKPRAPAASQDAPRSDGTNGHAPAETSNQTETAPPAAPEATAAPAEPPPEPEPTPPEPLQAEAAAPPIIPPPVTAAPEPTPPNASAPTQVPL
ncbi:MAG TPA: response regulator, partial [Chthoniobacterales bacterium]